MSIIQSIATNNENAKIAEAAKAAALKAKMDIIANEAFYHGKTQADKSLAFAGFQAGVDHGAKNMFETFTRNGGVPSQYLGDMLGTPINMDRIQTEAKINALEKLRNNQRRQYESDNIAKRKILGDLYKEGLLNNNAHMYSKTQEPPYNDTQTELDYAQALEESKYRNRNKNR